MPHKSEDTQRLTIQNIDVASIEEFPIGNPDKAEVWFILFPYGRSLQDAEASENWFKKFVHFAEGLHNDSIVTILTTAQDATETWPKLSNVLQFQLWIVVKYTTPLNQTGNQLPEHHAALLVLSKFKKSLRHTKTRTAYTYCPACDKTTKDYGGKKHTYNEYGTIISDIWRDVSYTPREYPNEIVIRLADLFGLHPYSNLTVVNILDMPSGIPGLHSVNTTISLTAETLQEINSYLIKGDSISELRKIPSNSIDFCFADPPYNLDKRYDSWDDAIDAQHYFTWCDNWIDELARVLKPGCTCAILNIPILAIRHVQHMKKDLLFQSWIAWEGLSLPVRMIMPAHYAIVCFSKGEPRPLPGLVNIHPTPLEVLSLNSLQENFCIRQSCVAKRKRNNELDRQSITDLWWDIHRLKHNSRRVDHPCQLPPTLMRRLIALFTEEKEVVLDPFNGAGTTTLCAAELSRRYIGIELSDNYHEIAVERHKQLETGNDPFAKTNGIPHTKNNRVGRIGGIKYEVPKKTLQLEVKRVADLIGHVPTREELLSVGRYSISYYDEYFVSWGEVCAAARATGMSEYRIKPQDVAY